MGFYDTGFSDLGLVGVALPLSFVFWWCLFEGPEVVLLAPRPVSYVAGLLGCLCYHFGYIRWVPPRSGCLLLGFFFVASYVCVGLVVLGQLLSPDTWICD